MVRQRGLEYTIKVEDKFSASLATLNAQLATTAANLRTVGSSVMNMPSSGGPVKMLGEILTGIKGSTPSIRAASKNVGTLSAVFGSLSRNVKFSAVNLKAFVTQLRALNQAAGAVATKVVQPFQQAPKSLQQTNTQLKQTEGFFDRIARIGVRVLGIFLLFQAAKGFARGLKDLVTQAFEFNAQVEQSVLGVRALIATLFQAADAQGKILTPAERFAKSTKEANKQVTLLRIAGLKTAATFEDLLFAFQTALAPGAAAGFTLDQIRDLTVLISQAAQALGVEQTQLAEEIRSLFQATPSARATRLAVLFSEGELKKAKEAGTLFQLLTSRFEQFGRANDESIKNFAVRLSNVRDAIKQVLGTGLIGFFTKFSDALQEVTDLLIQTDKVSGKISINPDALKVLQQFDRSLTNVFLHLKNTVQELGFAGLERIFTAVFKTIEVSLIALINATGLLIDIFADVVEVARVLGAGIKSLAGAFSGLTKSLGVSDEMTKVALKLLVIFEAGGFVINMLKKLSRALGITALVTKLSGALKTLVVVLSDLAAGVSIGAILQGAFVGAAGLLTTLAAIGVAVAGITAAFVLWGEKLPEIVLQAQILGKTIRQWRDLIEVQILRGLVGIIDTFLNELIIPIDKFLATLRPRILRFVADIIADIAKQFASIPFSPLAPFFKSMENAARGFSRELTKSIDAINDDTSLLKSALSFVSKALKERAEQLKGATTQTDRFKEATERAVDALNAIAGQDGGAIFSALPESMKDASDLLTDMAKKAEEFQRQFNLEAAQKGVQGLKLEFIKLLNEEQVKSGETLAKLNKAREEALNNLEAIRQAASKGTIDPNEIRSELALAMKAVADARQQIADIEQKNFESARAHFLDLIRQEVVKSKASVDNTQQEINAERELFIIRSQLLEKQLPKEVGAGALKIKQLQMQQRATRELLQQNQEFIQDSIDQEQDAAKKNELQELLNQLKRQQLQLDDQISQELHEQVLSLGEVFAEMRVEIDRAQRELGDENVLASMSADATDLEIELKSLEQQLKRTFDERQKTVLDRLAGLRIVDSLIDPGQFAAVMAQFATLEAVAAKIVQSEKNIMASSLANYVANLRRKSEVDAKNLNDRIALIREANKLEADAGLSTLKQQEARAAISRAEQVQEFELFRKQSDANIALLKTMSELPELSSQRLTFEAAITALYQEQGLRLEELQSSLDGLNASEKRRLALLTEQGAVAQFGADFRDDLATRGQVIFDALVALKEGITDTLGGALSDALFRRENTLLERAQRLAESIVDIFIKEFLKRSILKTLFGSIGVPLDGGGIGGYKGGLVGRSGFGRASLAHGGARGYADGGIARPRGLHPSDVIPAWLAAGEFVIPREQVRAYGINFLESMRRGILDPSRARAALAGQRLSARPGIRAAERAGFASGGLVRSGGVRVTNAQERPSQNGPTIVNVFDPDQLPALLASAGGQAVITNVVDARLAARGIR